MRLRAGRRAGEAGAGEWRAGLHNEQRAAADERQCPALPRTASWLGKNMAQSPPAAPARKPMSTQKVSRKYRQPMKSTAKGEVPRGVPGGAPPLPAAVPLTASGEDEPDVHHTSAMVCTLAPPTAAAAAAAVTAQRAIPRARRRRRQLRS